MVALYFVVAVALAFALGWVVRDRRRAPGDRRVPPPQVDVAAVAREAARAVLEEPLPHLRIERPAEEPKGLSKKRWTLFTDDMEPIEGLEGTEEGALEKIRAHRGPKWDRNVGGFR